MMMQKKKKKMKKKLFFFFLFWVGDGGGGYGLWRMVGVGSTSVIVNGLMHHICPCK